MALPCKAPCWTACFGFTWVILAVGAVLMHISLRKTVPAITDLPANLEKGFGVIFGFDVLEGEAQNIQTNAQSALQLCSTSMVACVSPPSCDSSSDLTSYDTNAKKQAIVASFQAGLQKIMVIGKDPYFGIDQIAQAGEQLDNITADLDNLNTTGPCCAQVPLYCQMHKSAGELVNMSSTVSAKIDEMINNDQINQFKDNASYLKYLHVLPYFLALSMLFFGALWCMNGACCCCTGGSCKQFVLLVLPMAFFWLVSFVVMGLFAGIGYAVEFVLMDVELPSGTFKGSPTVGDLIDHIQLKFTDFWDLVFADLEEGLLLFRQAASIYVFACLLFLLYSFFFCCCRPYNSRNKTEEKQLQVSKPPQDKETSQVSV